MKKPRVFISHCENNFEPTDFAIRVIDLIGCTPVIAETQPKLSRTVFGLVSGTLDSCDVVIVIATPDSDSEQGKKSSEGVLVEIGMLLQSDKFKNKFAIIKEQSVNFGPMIPQARYKFQMGNYAPIAEAILVELSSMGFFKNYFELNGSEWKFHEFMDSIYSLKELNEKGHLNTEYFENAVKDLMTKVVNKIIGK